MERTAVQSREIAVVGYEKESSTLEITFRRGGVYHYRQVPAAVYQALMEADSLGSYFSQNIKDHFPCKKVS